MNSSLDQNPLARVDFLDLISHELSQPLTAAQGSIATILDRSLELSPEQRGLLLEIATRNLDQLSDLLDSLRVFSQADRGELVVRVLSVPIEELFAHCVQDFPEPRTRRHIVTECPPGLEIRVDKTLFKQVITNLVANAIKFSPPGSTITLSAAARDRETVITVKDEGDGFPLKEAERIFEKSVRLDHDASGLGLGLYVARAIVEAHRGHVTASTERGQGARFEVAVPA